MKMKTSVLLTIMGISATCLVGGLSLLFEVNLPARLLGVFLVTLGVALPFCALVYYKIKDVTDRGIEETNRIGSFVESNFDSLKQEIARIEQSVQDYSRNLTELVDRMGFENNAMFVADGFIGLQRRAIGLESNHETGFDYVRMAVHRHLPSYMRLSDISENTARVLYKNWEPPQFIPEYHDLINQRRKAFQSFVEKGGRVKEIYDRSSIVRYAEQGIAMHDEIIDPIDEIRERLKALLYYIDKPNYEIALFDNNCSAPPFLLKTNVGMVLDFRTTGTDYHFNDSIDGLYTNSDDVLKVFVNKFLLLWKNQDKSETRRFISDLLRQLEKKSRTPTDNTTADVDYKLHVKVVDE